MVRGFKARANRIAVAVRADLGLPAHAPLDPLAVCQHFDIEVINDKLDDAIRQVEEIVKTKAN